MHKFLDPKPNDESQLMWNRSLVTCSVRKSTYYSLSFSPGSKTAAQVDQKKFAKLRIVSESLIDVRLLLLFPGADQVHARGLRWPDTPVSLQLAWVWVMWGVEQILHSLSSSTALFRRTRWLQGKWRNERLLAQWVPSSAAFEESKDSETVPRTSRKRDRFLRLHERLWR